jgi:dynein regulatory complex protein 1
LIEVKDGLIGEYITELKAKDDEYVRELKRQAEEIDKLLDRMDNQFRAYQTSLTEEIDQIEKALIAERSEMIASNRRETEVLLENRRNAEAFILNNPESIWKTDHSAWKTT